MNNIDFADKAIKVTAYKTLYVNGCFGAPMTTANKSRYTVNTPYNKKPERTAKIKAASEDTFGFDCVGLIKGLLWGWNGNLKARYGGSTYGSNGVPDISEDTMIQKCNPSTDFKKIVTGAVVWMPGHIGIYVGDGLVVESSPIWKDGVQITALGNIGTKKDYNTRFWTKWGKLPYLDYEDDEDDEMVVEKEMLSNGKIVKVKTILKDGENFVRLRDLDDKMGIAKVDYDSVKKLPIINKA